MSDSDDELIQRLAESITDGKPVDWDAASSTDEALQRRLRRLRVLESIGSVSGLHQDAGAQPDSRVGSAQDRPGGQRWGHLEIHERIGQGIFGDVYRAWEATLEREVAVKFLRLGSRATPFAAHVLQEGRTMARVRHPNVITVYGAEELEGRVGFWMEYIRGGTLEEVLETQGAFGPWEAALIGVDLCRALAAVHQAGLVHRDVKTRNVMREEGGRIVLMDFGTGVEMQPSGRIRAFASAGTPVYQAPEILRGEPASPRSDLFSLGVLLYRLVTRSYPVEAESFEQLREAYTAGKVRLLRDVRPDLPAAFSQAIERATAIDPERRFATAGDMEQALEAALEAGRAAKTRPAAAWDTIERVPARTSRLPRGLLVLSIALVVGLGAGGAGLLLHRQRGLGRHSGGERLPVAVADVVNETMERELDGLAGMLTTSLEQSQRLSVLTRSRMSDILAQLGKDRGERIDEDVGRQICRQAHVRDLLIPSVRKFGELYTIDLVVLDPVRNEYVFSTREETHNREQIPAMIDAVSAKIRSQLISQPSEMPTAIASVAQITTQNLEAYEHFDAGERDIDRLQMDDAREEFEEAIAIDSSFGLAYARLAYADWWLSDFQNQAAHLDKALALIDRIPAKEQFRVRAQYALVQKQGLEAARAILFQMEKAYPDDKEMLYDIGDLSSHLSEYYVAVRYLLRVADADPRFERALQHLARTFRDLDRAPDALEWARRYAAAGPSWETADLLGSATIAIGDFDAGSKILLEARSTYPEQVLPLTRSLTDGYLVHERFVAVDSVWATYFGGHGSPGEEREAYRTFGFQEAYQGRYKEALDDLGKALERSEVEGTGAYTGVLHADRALLWWLGRGDAVEARRELDAGARYDGGITYADAYFQYWPYWGRLFKMYLARGEVDRARTLANTKLEQDAWFRPYVHAYLQCAAGECDQARSTADTLLQWGPAAENIELLYALSACSARQGRLSQAEELLLRLQALDSNLTGGSPFIPKGCLLLGQVYEGRHETEKARQTYTKLLRLWNRADPDLPDVVEARRRLAQLEAAPVRH